MDKARNPSRRRPDTTLSLVAFAEAGWLEGGSEHAGDDLHRSRAQLIIELKQDLGVNDEAVPIILDLVDQLYGVRRALRLALAEARRGGKDGEGAGLRVRAMTVNAAVEGRARPAPRLSRYRLWALTWSGRGRS